MFDINILGFEGHMISAAYSFFSFYYNPLKDHSKFTYDLKTDH